MIFLSSYVLYVQHAVDIFSVHNADISTLQLAAVCRVESKLRAVKYSGDFNLSAANFSMESSRPVANYSMESNFVPALGRGKS